MNSFGNALLVFVLAMAARSTVAMNQRGAHFVLVNGGWQGRWVWFQVKPQLESAGHSVTAIELPAHGVDMTPVQSLKSLPDVAAPIIKAVRASPTPVILVGHSFAGALISTVAELVPHKVAKLVYLAAFLLPNNVSVFDLVTQPKYSSLLGQNSYTIPSKRGPPLLFAIKSAALRPAVFNRCAPEVAALGELLYRDEPLISFITPVRVSGARWGRIPRYYVYADADNSVNPRLQKDMVRWSGVTRAFFVKGSDHEPHLSKPRATAYILKAVANA